MTAGALGSTLLVALLLPLVEPAEDSADEPTEEFDGLPADAAVVVELLALDPADVLFADVLLEVQALTSVNPQTAARAAVAERIRILFSFWFGFVAGLARPVGADRPLRAFVVMVGVRRIDADHSLVMFSL